MPTVLELLNLTCDYFSKKDIDSPRLTAELLLANVLGCKRIDLYLAYNKPLQSAEVDAYRESIKKRIRNTPVQYITGTSSFYGLDFRVNESVLIPRPETELLVEEVIKHYQGNGRVQILDIGTGSGNIAVSLAVNLPGCRITAVDFEDAPLKTAAENAELHKVSDNITFIKHDILNGSGLENTSFNAIVSNPPYIPNNVYTALKDGVIGYEPKSALTDGKNGLTFYQSIIEKAGKYLEKGGWLFFEIGSDQANTVASLMENNGFDKVSIIQDYAKLDRIVKGRLL